MLLEEIGNMKIERTKNATRNIVFGSILKIYQIVIPFLMRTAIIYLLGIKYLGLNSLFASILQVLNLAELGVGSAMVFSMYKPIAEDDCSTICALLKLYRAYYRIIGIVILIAGCLLLPFLTHLVKGDIPSDINIYALYLMNLFATVLTYWIFAYKNSILQAHQRNDVGIKITIVTDTIKYVLQIITLAIFRSYYCFVFVVIFTQILTNIVTAFFVNKLYPQYKPSGSLENEERTQINTRIWDLFTSKIGLVVVSSTDTIVISAFLGLTTLAIYQNYFYIITAVLGLISILFASSMAGIGNSLVLESKEKNYNDFKKITFIVVWIAGWCTVCLLCLFQPFMEIWVGKNLMLGFSAVICFCVYCFTYAINQLLNLYKDAAGMWHEDRFRPLATAGVNLTLNLILVNFIGIYGIILSTVLSMIFVGMPWLLHNLFTVIFKRNPIQYILQLVQYTITIGAICAITYFIVNLLPETGNIIFILKIFVCCIVPNILFFLCFRYNTEYIEAKKMIMEIIKKEG